MILKLTKRNAIKRHYQIQDRFLKLFARSNRLEVNNFYETVTKDNTRKQGISICKLNNGIVCNHYIEYWTCKDNEFLMFNFAGNETTYKQSIKLFESRDLSLYALYTRFFNICELLPYTEDIED